MEKTHLLCLSVPSQLVLTVGLLAVVVYLYTVVAFNFFRKFYNKSEDDDEPDMKCDDMMTVRAHSGPPGRPALLEKRGCGWFGELRVIVIEENMMSHPKARSALERWK